MDSKSILDPLALSLNLLIKSRWASFGRLILAVRNSSTHVHTRPIDPNSLSEIETVATRMRDTLIEVLGEDRGAQMYTLEWLIDRVRFHLDRDRCTGEVFLATNSSGDILGHTIVRLDQEENSNLIGLFSTFYISPNHRQMGIGRAFFSAGEQWFCQHGMALAVTYTHPTNIGLRTLAEKIGYRCDPINEDFVRLSKPI